MSSLVPTTFFSPVDRGRYSNQSADCRVSRQQQAEKNNLQSEGLGKLESRKSAEEFAAVSQGMRVFSSALLTPPAHFPFVRQ